MVRIPLAALLLSVSAFSQCIPISEAPQHVGQKACVAGKVLTVKRGEHESLNLNFCLQNAPCPFIVRIFPEDLDYVGDVRQLIGKEIEITGKIKACNGHTEMALKDADQLRGDSAKLLASKDYDAQRQSLRRYSGKERSQHRHYHPRNEGGEEFEVQKQ
ncbi:MAG TPA: hypothetical protein VMU28_11480 [Terriglobales bacterium]|nr:hypothetical protein [Terriglobales bacterium]